MKTLDHIWNARNENGSEDIDKLLCDRICKLARIVLRQLGIQPFDRYYEDYVQEAYLKFFEVIETFDPNKGKLEGYFMVSYKNDMYRELKRRWREDKNLSLHPNIVSNEPTPSQIFESNDSVDKFKEKLTSLQSKVLDYLRDEKYTLEDIAELEGESLDDVVIARSDLMMLAKQYFK